MNSVLTASDIERTESQQKNSEWREEEEEEEERVGITAAVFSNVKNGATLSAREKTNCQNDRRRSLSSQTKPNIDKTP